MHQLAAAVERPAGGMHGGGLKPGGVHQAKALQDRKMQIGKRGQDAPAGVGALVGGPHPGHVLHGADAETVQNDHYESCHFSSLPSQPIFSPRAV